ncbi:hypothetical protein WUBG_12321 [Wuchereria bancrofti]|uniref:Uncharacterized protein n=1 Tax=Wuchereria bancrofti TaxID=6293 RepID=J9AQX5_WUCBA|nr:hypothetical protein WUBG_12321 [Wuchereria bancrofti]VDM21150.1 unnamed protein product [Wuchereria bancrofti]
MKGTKSILVLLVILLLFEYVESYGWGYPGYGGGYYGGGYYGAYRPYGGYRPYGWGYGGGMFGRGFGALGSLLGKKK